jgi:Phosphotransferase enzyme family
VKVSTPSGTVPDPGDAGFVQAAWRRIEAMRSAEVETMEPPTLCELERVLGTAVRACDLFAENWRNRIYRIELSDGELVLGKQLVMGTDAMVQYQYEQLRALAALEIPRLRVPRALALLPAKRLVLAEFVPGKTIEALAWTSEEVLTACELAGDSLARLQLARTDNIGPVPVEALSRDLAGAPWRLSRRENKILQTSLEALRSAEVRMGEVYRDYKPANLIFQNNGSLFLVDPPDIQSRGMHLWDFACFRSSMRRHLWRITLRKPYGRHRRAIVRKSMVAFQEAYLTRLADAYPAPPLFAPTVRLLELQRNAVLKAMQMAKVAFAREKMPIASGKRLGRPLGNRLTLPLLEIEKRWLFRQLARELPS